MALNMLCLEAVLLSNCFITRVTQMASFSADKYIVSTTKIEKVPTEKIGHRTQSKIHNHSNPEYKFQTYL